MTTFSQIVDKIILELLRPDQLAAGASYANQTIRELHFRSNLNAPVKYDANRYEAEEPIVTNNVQLWSIPKPSQFQDVEAIFIPEIGFYVPASKPSLSRKTKFEINSDLFWYRGGNTIAVSGVRSGWTMQISYFQYPRGLPYFVVADREVIYDPIDDTYKRKTGGTPSEAELELATNWLLERWSTVIEEGIRAKLWKRVSDESRARMAFSAYESMRTAMWNSEPSS